MAILYGDYTDTVSLEIPANPFEALMQLDLTTVDGGKFLDLSGNDLHADAVTIDEANDGLLMNVDADLREVILINGLYDLFYNSEGEPIPVRLSTLGRIYNNFMFNNDDSLLVYEEPLAGSDLLSINNSMFGEYDSDAMTIISAIGVTSELEKRLVDTHVKDLKAINSIQNNFVLFGNPTNSAIKVLYGIVGDEFDQVKFNWINPLNSDAGNRLAVASGGVDFYTPDNALNFDGGTALTTFFNALEKLGTPNSFSFYSACNIIDGDDYKSLYSSDNCYDMGCLGISGGYKGIALLVRRDKASHSICENTYQNPSKGVQYAETNSRGLYLTNKLSASDLKQYKDLGQIGSTVTDSGESEYYDGNVILGGCSVDGSIDTTQRSILVCGYSHIGDQINADAVKPFQEAVLRLCSSKNQFFFKPIEQEIE